MDFGKLLKWIVIVAILIFAWKFVVPWVREKAGSLGGTSSSSEGGNACVEAGARASEAWGSDLSRFVNPPYDLDAWSSFTNEVEGEISAAESDCRCSEEWCVKVRSAMAELRSLVSDLDSAIRSGSPPPGDLVSRQEAIDDAINDARGLATGK